jgi:hypothetical protein
VTEQIRCDDTVLDGQSFDLTGPGFVGTEQTVYQHDRWTVTDIDVAEHILVELDGIELIARTVFGHLSGASWRPRELFRPKVRV